MALIDALRKEWQKKQSRAWNRIYIAVDLHDTIMPSNYDGVSVDIYPEAVECLSYLSSREDIILILWSGTKNNDITFYRESLAKHGIRFDYVNENPLETSNELSDFSKKFYFNLIFDDKAGFVPSDYEVVLDFFRQHQ